MCHLSRHGREKEAADEAGETGRARVWADPGVIPQLMMGRARLKLSVCASVSPSAPSALSCLSTHSPVQSSHLLLGWVVRPGTEE